MSAPSRPHCGIDNGRTGLHWVVRYHDTRNHQQPMNWGQVHNLGLGSTVLAPGMFFQSIGDRLISKASHSSSVLPAPAMPNRRYTRILATEEQTRLRSTSDMV